MYDELKDTLIKAKTHPHTFGWFCLVSQFNEGTRKMWAAAGAAQAGGKNQGGKQKGKQGKKQKKEEDVEMDDLFADDGDDGAEAAKKAAAAAKDKGKKKKKEVIAMSLVMLEVKPLDDKTDLDKVA